MRTDLASDSDSVLEWEWESQKNQHNTKMINDHRWVLCWFL